MEVNMQALRQQYDRDLQAKEEEGEEKKRILLRQVMLLIVFNAISSQNNAVST